MKRNTFSITWLATVLAMAFATTSVIQGQDHEAAPAAESLVSTNSTAGEPGVSERGKNVSTTNRAVQRASIEHGPTVTFWSDAILKPGEVGKAVVAIGGSAKAFGKVEAAVVGIGGDARAAEDVGAAVVAIGGDAAAQGKVGAALVAIGGNAEARGEVNDGIVAVMGDVKIGSNAVVHSEVVSVGGKVEVEPGAQVHGKVTEVGIGPLLIPLKAMTDWLKHCAVKFRLLAPQPSWFWIIPGFYLFAYLVITVLFPKPVAACAHEITQRPATTFLLGLLTELLVPLTVAVLAMTAIGTVAVPFIYVAVFIGGLIGKAALLQILGRQLVRAFGFQFPPAVLAMLLGFTLITLLYMVPFLCLLVYALVALWGIGSAVTATFGGMRKESPPSPAATPPPESAFAPAPGATNSTVGGVVSSSGVDSMAAEASVPPMFAPPAGSGTETSLPPKLLVPPVASEALTLPRAGFWERMGAAFLDVILLSILGKIVGGAPLVYLVALAYFAGMWAWKGTTVGGLVLNLKVVRLDDKPVTFVVALVRGLAAGFSVIVLFLGFFWMIWDREKQSWHDKIAGTVVVRQPRGMPLVCL